MNNDSAPSHVLMKVHVQKLVLYVCVHLSMCERHISIHNRLMRHTSELQASQKHFL